MIASRDSSAIIHLLSSASSTVDDATSMAQRNFNTAIKAATVTDDYFAIVGHPVMLIESQQALIETIGLIQYRDDNADLGCIGQSIGREIRSAVNQGLRYNYCPGLQCSHNSDRRY